MMNQNLKLNLGSSRRAFSSVDLLMIVLALAAIIFVILPRMAKTHAHSAKLSCTNHLKQIGLVYRIWAIDNGNKFPMSVSATNGGTMELAGNGVLWPTFAVMSNELNTPKLLICPKESNPKRVMATTFARSVPSGQPGQPFAGDTNVSYFIGLEADETQPNTILSGDDNFLVNGVPPKSGVLSLWTNSAVAWTKDRHVKQGNIAFADGSVLGASTPKLAEVLVKTGAATNRLAMP